MKQKGIVGKRREKKEVKKEELSQSYVKHEVNQRNRKCVLNRVISQIKTSLKKV